MDDLAKETAKEKLAQCVEALTDLQKYREVGTLEYLRANPDTYYAICYRFIAVFEALFDLGQYMLAIRGIRAESQREIPALLGREKIVNENLVQRFGNMYGFRNRLVHAYGTLDDEKVAAFLQTHLSDIEEVLAAAKDLIQK